MPNLGEKSMPLESQVRWLWERCGLKFDFRELPSQQLPLIDLNSLFKYAVPILDIDIPYYVPEIVISRDKASRTDWLCYIDDCDELETGETPALALFWAIYKSLGGV